MTTEAEALCCHDPATWLNVILRLSARVQFENETGSYSHENINTCSISRKDVSCGPLILKLMLVPPDHC